MPEQFPLRSPISKISEKWLNLSGLWQGWGMFAPNPIKEDIYVSAKISLADSSSVAWELSRMEEMGFLERYRKERWRKWASDNLRLDSSKELWPSAAEWIAKTISQEEGSPVRSIELIRHWRPVATPDTTGLIGERAGWHQFVFYQKNF